MIDKFLVPLLLLLVVARAQAADADVTLVDPEAVASVRQHAPVLVSGTFRLVPEQEPADGIGEPGAVAAVELLVGETFKGSVRPGDVLTVSVANGSLAYNGTFITREQMFFFRQERADALNRELLARHERYGAEVIQRGLTSVEIAAMLAKFGEEYLWVAERTADIHVTRGRVLDSGAVPELPLIAEGREYLVALQPDGANNYELWPGQPALWWGVDTLFVKKLLAQPSAP